MFFFCASSAADVSVVVVVYLALHILNKNIPTPHPLLHIHRLAGHLRVPCADIRNCTTTTTQQPTIMPQTCRVFAKQDDTTVADCTVLKSSIYYPSLFAPPRHFCSCHVGSNLATRVSSPAPPSRSSLGDPRSPREERVKRKRTSGAEPFFCCSHPPPPSRFPSPFNNNHLALPSLTRQYSPNHPDPASQKPPLFEKNLVTGVSVR